REGILEGRARPDSRVTQGSGAMAGGPDPGSIGRSQSEGAGSGRRRQAPKPTEGLDQQLRALSAIPVANHVVSRDGGGSQADRSGSDSVRAPPELLRAGSHGAARGVGRLPAVETGARLGGGLLGLLRIRKGGSLTRAGRGRPALSNRAGTGEPSPPPPH